jgi:SPP1 gp7 family putative phage head morphogenesis protein
MEDIATYQHIQIYQYDPTRTTFLRNKFARDVKRRFNELITVINKSVAVNDCFGLKPIQIFQMIPASQNSMKQRNSSEKLALFALWLQDQIDRGIIQSNTAWTDAYVLEAYKRGIIRSRYEMQKAGYDVPTMEESGGITTSMQNPKHHDLVTLLYLRIVNDMKGVTEAMKASILFILAQGLAANDSAEVLAQKLTAVIPLKRAEMIARNAVIIAFAEGQLTEFELWGVDEVGIMAEWQTMLDEKVCSRCSAMEGQLFTIDEARGMIPLHPNCRCLWILRHKKV